MDRLKTNKKGVGLLLALSLVASFALVFGSFRDAHGQGQSNTNALGTGLPRGTASSTVSIAAGTPAAIVTAVTGKVISPKALKLICTAGGGLVTFYDGADATKPIGLNVYVPTASTSTLLYVDVPESYLAGVKTTAGNALCAQLNGATLSFIVEYQLQ